MKLHQIKSIYNIIQLNKAFNHDFNQRAIHVNSSLNNKILEKPKWLKKMKLTQAIMQKDDHRPIFLKKGFMDKVLFNFTLILIGASVFGVVQGTMSLSDTDGAN